MVLTFRWSSFFFQMPPNSKRHKFIRSFKYMVDRSAVFFFKCVVDSWGGFLFFFKCVVDRFLSLW